MTAPMGEWLALDTVRIGLAELKSALRITVILVAAWIIHAVSRRIVWRLRSMLAGRADDVEQAKRIETLARVVRYALTVIVVGVAGMLVLDELGVSIAPILGAAGVVGIAIGFGAQSLIKDYFTGFFLLIEDQVRVGDVVEVAGKSGRVEEITLRRLKLRDSDGAVHYVANSLITAVTNRSTDFAHAQIEVGIADRGQVDAAIGVLQDVAQRMRTDPQYGLRILGDLEVVGTEEVAGATVVQARMSVVPLEQWDVRREFLRRAREGLAQADIETRSPQILRHRRAAAVQAASDADTRAP